MSLFQVWTCFAVGLLAKCFYELLASFWSMVQWLFRTLYTDDIQMCIPSRESAPGIRPMNYYSVFGNRVVGLIKFEPVTRVNGVIWMFTDRVQDIDPSL